MNQESAIHIMKTGKNVFITGAPGTGKTHVLNKYIEYLKKHGIKAAITAPTGIAASHIGGMTIHSFFGIGIKDSLSQYDIEELMEKKYIWDRIKNLKVLIIDEVSMLSPKLFISIDNILRTFKFSTESFGGIQVILVGDFFQLPPIQKEKNSERFIFQTDTWNSLDLYTCYLNKSYRHKDEILLNILNEIRNGNISEESMRIFRSRYRKNPIQNKDKENKNNISITRLYTHNIDVDEINKKELSKIKEPLKIYNAQTTGSKKWYERIFGSSLVLQKLELKLGALVFFIKNNYEKGHINGTIGTIIDFDVFNIPIIETKDGKRIKAESMEWLYTDNNGNQKASIKQIPLRLAWAITIHKSQGMTLDSAEIDLSRAFEPGQGYVALSRIKSINGLKLMGLNDIALKIDNDVLKGDNVMKNHSKDIISMYSKISETEKEKSIKEYMEYLGGSIEKGKTYKKEISKEKKSKIKSFLKSKPFFEQKRTISEISKDRKISEQTILNHLELIIEDDPEFDISYLQPNSDIIEKVEIAINGIRKKNLKKNFTENGKIKLSAIFKKLNEEISYEEIKLAMLFL